MWILPKNYPLSSAFAQDMVASKEDLTLLESSMKSSLMWRSKPSPLRTWLQRWKRGNWVRHLFTRILKPSHQKSFEALLTSSLEATRARRSQQQVSEQVQQIQDICGHSSGSMSDQLDLLEPSLKMFTDTHRLDCPQSLAIWKKMVTQELGEYSQRQKSGHLTKGRESLSWATPTAHLAKEGGYPAEWTRNSMSLTAEVHKAENLPHSSGHVNPAWLEWLMGVPTKWTDLGSWGTG